MARTTRQKTNKEREHLNIIDQYILTDIYRTLHPPRAAYTFFSSTHRTFSRIDHILEYVRPQNKSYKCKKMEIIPTVFSDQNRMKLKNQYQRNNWNINKYVEIKQHTLEIPVGQRKHHKGN